MFLSTQFLIFLKFEPDKEELVYNIAGPTDLANRSSLLETQLSRVYFILHKCCWWLKQVIAKEVRTSQQVIDVSFSGILEQLQYWLYQTLDKTSQKSQVSIVRDLEKKILAFAKPPLASNNSHISLWPYLCASASGCMKCKFCEHFRQHKLDIFQYNNLNRKLQRFLFRFNKLMCHIYRVLGTSLQFHSGGQLGSH